MSIPKEKLHSIYINNLSENLKMGCAQNHLIVDIINENIEFLKGIEKEIDNDFKREFTHFDPTKDDTIRKKLNNDNEIILPTRELKFERMLNDYISGKVNFMLKIGRFDEY